MKKLIIAISFILFASHSVFAMKAEDVAAEEVPKSAKVKQVTARERLAIAKRYFESYPGINMITKVKGLHELYVRDHAYILSRLPKHKHTAAKIKLMGMLNKFVDEHYRDEMSFADYNYISTCWIEILDKKDDKIEEKPFADTFAAYSKVCNIFRGGNDGAESRLSFNFTVRYGLVLPHVSPTGAVPIKVINDGFGFFYGDGNPGALTLLALSTSPKNRFDYLKDQGIRRTWYHDIQHMGFNGIYDASSVDEYPYYLSLMERIAKIRTKVKSLEGIERAQAEYAFFYIFHEKISNNLFYASQMTSRMRVLSLMLASELTPEGKGFSSYDQYETYTKGALHLRLPIVTTDDLEMKKTKDYVRDDKTEKAMIFEYRKVLEHEKKGLELLQKIFSEMLLPKKPGQTTKERIAELKSVYEAGIITDSEHAALRWQVAKKAYRPMTKEEASDWKLQHQYWRGLDAKEGELFS